MATEQKSDIYENKEVIVHSSAIQITSNISLLQRKSWLYLLYKAYNLLPQQNHYSVSVKELQNAIGFDSNNREYLKEALRGLTATSVEWNIFNKDRGMIWKCSALLAEVEIDKENCIYQISDSLRERLHNPKMYVKVCLALQNRFRSKNAHALYLLLLDYAFQKNITFTIKEIRQYLALKEDEYKVTADFIFHIIKKSVSEINDLSNLFVSTEFIKDNRKIAAIKFNLDIDKKSIPQIPEPLERKVVVTASKQNIKINESTIKNNILKKFLSSNEISLKVLAGFREKMEQQDSIPQEHQEDYFLFLKDYCEKQSDVKNMAGLFINLVKTGEQSENYLFKLSQEIEKKKDEKKELKEKFNHKIKAHYDHEELGTVQKYLKEHENIFYKLIEENRANIAIIFAIKKNSGQINPDLLKNTGILKTLIDQVQQQPDYSFMSFEEWKKQWEANPDNEELIKQAEKDAGYTN